MVKKFVDNFIFWLYDKLEEEKLRRKALVDNLVNEFIAEKAKLREEQRKLDAQKWLDQIAVKQSKCSHQKGGGLWSPPNDYAVWRHTFPDGHETIRCLICSKEWSKENGNYEEGLNLTTQSTNTASASEHVTYLSKDGEPIDRVDRYEPERCPPSKQNPSSPEEQYMPFITTRWMEYLKVLWKRAKTGSDE